MNFWDIDIAHYGAYSLYLEAIRRTDRLVHELWQHVAVAAAVPRSHDAARRARARTRQRRGRQRVREPPQRRRVVPARLARGASAPACRRAPGTERPIRTRTSRRPSRGFSGSRCRSARAGLSRKLSVSEPRCSSTSQALDWETPRALARAHAAILSRLPATVHAFILVELQKWPTLFAARAALPAGAAGSPVAPAEDLSWTGAIAGIARIEDRGRLDQIARAQPGALPGRGAGAAAQARAAGRPGARRSTPSSGRSTRRSRPSSIRRCAAPLVVQIYGSGIAVQRDKLWSRFKGTGVRVPLNLGGTDGHPRHSSAAVGGQRGRRRRAGPAQGSGRASPAATPGSSNRTTRCTRCATRRQATTSGDALDRTELRPSAPVPRRADAGALQQDPEWRREPAGVCRLRAQPADRARRPVRCSTPADHPVAFVRDVLLTGNGTLFDEQHVRRMGGGAGDQARPAARPDHPVRRPRQAEAVQQHGAVLPAPAVRSRCQASQDPAGSFIDVEQLSYYVWLNAEKTPPTAARRSICFSPKAIDEMLAIRSDRPAATASGLPPARLTDVYATMAHWTGAPASGQPIDLLVS